LIAFRAQKSRICGSRLIIQSGGWGCWNGRAEGSARSVVEFVAVEGERLRDAESCAQVIDEFERAASIVAVHPLAALVTLLRLDLRGRPIGEIGMVLVLVMEMLQRLLGYLEDILPPSEQLVAEIIPLALVHERLFVGGPVGLVHIRLDRDLVLVSVRSNSDAVLLVHLRFQPLQNKAPLLAGELI
jgi:hypothetical protein